MGTIDSAFDDFADAVENIIDSYDIGDLDGLKTEIHAAVEKLFCGINDVDLELEKAKNTIADLEKKVEELEAEELTKTIPVFHVEIESLAMQEKIEAFVQKEIYPHYNDENKYWVD